MHIVGETFGIRRTNHVHRNCLRGHGGGMMTFSANGKPILS